MAGRRVVVEQVGEVGGGLVMEGFVSEEKDFELDPCGTGSQWSSWRTGVRWSREWERVSRQAGEQQSSGYTGVFLRLFRIFTSDEDTDQGFASMHGG